MNEARFVFYRFISTTSDNTTAPGRLLVGFAASSVPRRGADCTPIEAGAEGDRLRAGPADRFEGCDDPLGCVSVPERHAFVLRRLRPTLENIFRGASQSLQISPDQLICSQ